MSARFFSCILFGCAIVSVYYYISVYPVVKGLKSTVQGSKQMTHFSHIDFVLQHVCAETFICGCQPHKTEDTEQNYF
jgi:hypothetical protein